MRPSPVPSSKAPVRIVPDLIPAGLRNELEEHLKTGTEFERTIIDEPGKYGKLTIGVAQRSYYPELPGGFKGLAIVINGPGRSQIIHSVERALAELAGSIRTFDKDRQSRINEDMYSVFDGEG